MSTEPPSVEIELISAGAYKVLTPHPEGTPTEIVKTEWEGPAGGRRYLWETRTLGQWGWAIENYAPPGETLADARKNLAAYFADLKAELS